MPRGRPKKNVDAQPRKLYWTKVTDQFILDYNALEPSARRDLLFSKELYRPIKRLATEVLKYLVYTKKLQWDEEQRETNLTEIITHIASKLDHYRDIKLSGFSYFQTISKNRYLEILRQEAIDKEKLVPFELDDEDQDDHNSLANKLFHVDSKEVMGEYVDHLIEFLVKKNPINPELKIVLSTIIEYLEENEIPDINGLRVYLIHKLIDTNIFPEWKVDRLLQLEGIFLAIKDTTELRTVAKEGELADNDWAWIHDAFKIEYTPAQIQRRDFNTRKSVRKGKIKRNETPEQREHRLQVGKEYRARRREEMIKTGEKDLTYLKKKRTETPEQREIRLTKARERAREMVQLLNKPKESPEKRAEILDKARKAYSEKLKMMTDEEKQERRRIKKEKREAEKIYRSVGFSIQSQDH